MGLTFASYTVSEMEIRQLVGQFASYTVSEMEIRQLISDGAKEFDGTCKLHSV